MERVVERENCLFGHSSMRDATGEGHKGDPGADGMTVGDAGGERARPPGAAVRRGVIRGGHQSAELRAFATIGLLGAFTTFSTFSYEAVALIRDGDEWGATGYVAGSLLAGLVGVPVIVVVVEREEKIEEVLSDLDEMIGGGLITLERARIVMERPEEGIDGDE